METIIKGGYLSVKEFAKIRNITVQAVYMGIKAGRYQSKKEGGFTFVRE